MAGNDRQADGDERWRALACGELSETEVAALREEAERSEEGRAMFELYRPFTADEEEELFERIRARIGEERTARRRRLAGIVTVIIVALVAAASLWRCSRP